MGYPPVKSIFLFIFIIFTVAGCARQSSGPTAAFLDSLAGSYRVIWSDGAANDHTFTLKQKNGVWYMADEEDAVPMTSLAPGEIESIFGKDMARGAQCLEALTEASTIIICVTKPGTATEARIDDLMSYSAKFIAKTGYFSYIGHMGIWDLEKLK